MLLQLQLSLGLRITSTSGSGSSLFLEIIRHHGSPQCIHCGGLPGVLHLKAQFSKNRAFSITTQPSLIRRSVSKKKQSDFARLEVRSYHSEKTLFNFDFEWGPGHVLSVEDPADFELSSDGFPEEPHQLNQEISSNTKASWPPPYEGVQGGRGAGLQDLLSRYMKTVHIHTSREGREDDLDRSLTEFFDDASLSLLHSRGYDVLDLALWAWILQKPSSEKAALRLLTTFWVERNQSRPYSKVSPFVLFSLLRRPHITASALRYLILCVWDYFKMHRSSHPGSMDIEQSRADASALPLVGKAWMSPSKKNSFYRTMSEVTMIDLITELLRHARQTWPAAMTNISLMFTDHINGDGVAGIETSPKTIPKDVSAHLSPLCNRMLSLLALASRQHPWRSILHHQRAQLHILRWMSVFEPALTVTREGYRAMIYVQLLHRKTTREQEWAELKAKSWPPWKEDKLGLDVEIGIEMGVSRAAEILSRLQEAGYSTLSWEKAARIYAGWDTDNSPTIQTRSRESLFIARSRGLNLSQSTFKPQLSIDNAQIWTARVRATRTLDEAWACFLSYSNVEANPAQSVYFALIEKIVFDEKRVRGEKRQSRREEEEEREKDEETVKNHAGAFKDSEEALEGGEGDLEDDGKGPTFGEGISQYSPQFLPGDGPEVTSPANSPREQMYLPEPPPTLERFFHDMIKRGLKPSGRCLAFLLRQARFYPEGIKYLESSSLPEHSIRILRCKEDLDAEEIRRSLESIPDYLFAAYIQFISRFSNTVFLPSISVLQISEIAGLKETNGKRSENSKMYGPVRIPHTIAFRLLLARNPMYRPAWYALLAALLQPQRLAETGRKRHDRSVADDLVTWKIMSKLLMKMDTIKLDLDFDGFLYVCKGLEKALRASRVFISFLNRKEISRDSNERESFILGDADPELVQELSTFAESLLWRRASELKARFWNISSSFETVRMSVEPPLGSLRRNLVNCEADARAKGLPKLLDVPSPAVLHVYIRALGVAEDFGAIRGLCQWMVDHAAEIDSVAYERLSGPRGLRRTLIAVRVFLERSWLEYRTADDIANGDHGGLSQERANKKTLNKTRRIVERMERWGGWPTDMEVEAYCRGHKFM